MIANEWLTAALHIMPKPRISYVSLLRTQVLPTWSTVPLAKITYESVADWVAQLAADGSCSPCPTATRCG